MTTKFTFFIGLNDKDAHVQKLDAMAAANVITHIFKNHKCDMTLSSGQGVYTHADGTIVIENTIIATVYQFGAAIDVSAICDELKVALNQESVAVERSEVDSRLY